MIDDRKRVQVAVGDKRVCAWVLARRSGETSEISDRCCWWRRARWVHLRPLEECCTMLHAELVPGDPFFSACCFRWRNEVANEFLLVF